MRNEKRKGSLLNYKLQRKKEEPKPAAAAKKKKERRKKKKKKKKKKEEEVGRRTPNFNSKPQWGRNFSSSSGFWMTFSNFKKILSLTFFL